MGSEDLFKKQKTAKEKRKQSNKGRAKDSILIVCEGKQTEPNYFESFRLKHVTLDGCGHNTDSLVERAIEKSSDYDQVWCVFDKDSFPPHNFNRAFQITRKHKNIKIAYSNEAFELWYLLHFNYYDARMSRDQYKEKLTKLLKCEYKKKGDIIY